MCVTIMQINISGCFSILWNGRRLGSDIITRTQVATSLDNCEISCNKTNSCTAFSFGFLDTDRLNGRCEMTDLPTKFSSFSTWETSVTPLFNVYIKHGYCPEARFLIQPKTALAASRSSVSLVNSSSTNESAATEASGRILTTSPFFVESAIPLDLYPPGSYYLHNNIFPDSRKKQSKKPVCYEQALQARKLSQSRALVSRTAYYLEDCQDLCSREVSFRCRGFSYSQPLSQGDINNCQLTDQDLDSLDRFSSRDFLNDNRYDFYQRTDQGYNCRSSSQSCETLTKSEYKHYIYRDYKTVSNVGDCSQE